VVQIFQGASPTRNFSLPPIGALKMSTERAKGTCPHDLPLAKNQL
jgi:hypothetical protein